MRRLLSLVKWLIASSFITALGHRGTERFANFLLIRSRLDVLNDPITNGEYLVQSVALAKSAEERVVFDVGANVGDWLANALDSVNANLGLHVIAFEAHPETAKMLEARLKREPWQKRVRVEQLALSDRPGHVAFLSFGPGLGRNSIHPVMDLKPVEEIKVTATTIDLYCESHGVSQIHFLKIDAEGNDEPILEGARGQIAAGRIRFIQFEYNDRWIFARRFLRDAMALLNASGYAVGKVTGKGVLWLGDWTPALESFQEGNYIACRREDVPSFPAVRRR